MVSTMDPHHRRGQSGEQSPNFGLFCVLHLLFTRNEFHNWGLSPTCSSTMLSSNLYVWHYRHGVSLFKETGLPQGLCTLGTIVLISGITGQNKFPQDNNRVACDRTVVKVKGSPSSFIMLYTPVVFAIIVIQRCLHAERPAGLWPSQDRVQTPLVYHLSRI